MEPIPDRKCGECSACCIRLTIDVPELQKHADVPCQELSAVGGCRIYDTRPNVCRNWYCGWRFLDYLDDDWRPDRSGVLLRLEADGGIAFQSLKSIKVFIHPELLRFVGSLVESGIPVFFVMPGKPGHTSVKLQLNEALTPGAKARSYDLMAAEVVKALEFGANFQSDPIPEFKHAPPGLSENRNPLAWNHNT